VGGIKSITLIRPADVIMLPAADCSAVYNGDILYSTAYTIEADRNSANFNEKSNPGNANGDYLEQALTFSVNKDRLEVATLVQGTLNQRLHIRIVYNDGTTKLMLNARAVTDHNSGTQRRDGVVTKWTFTGQARKRATLLSIPVEIDNDAFTTGFTIGYS
jgi:hypothetical protein